MSLVEMYEKHTLPKIVKNMTSWSYRAKALMSATARYDEATGTWNSSFDVNQTGTFHHIGFDIAPNIAVLKSNPAFISGKANGDYTEFIVAGVPHRVKLRGGGTAMAPQGGIDNTPSDIANALGDIMS